MGSLQLEEFCTSQTQLSSVLARIFSQSGPMKLLRKLVCQISLFFLVNVFIQDDMDTCTQHSRVTRVKVAS